MQDTRCHFSVQDIYLIRDTLDKQLLEFDSIKKRHKEQLLQELEIEKLEEVLVVSNLQEDSIVISQTSEHQQPPPKSFPNSENSQSKSRNTNPALASDSISLEQKMNENIIFNLEEEKKDRRQLQDPANLNHPNNFSNVNVINHSNLSNLENIENLNTPKELRWRVQFEKSNKEAQS